MRLHELIVCDYKAEVRDMIQHQTPWSRQNEAVEVNIGRTAIQRSCIKFVPFEAVTPTMVNRFLHLHVSLEIKHYPVNGSV